MLNANQSSSVALENVEAKLAAVSQSLANANAEFKVSYWS